MFPIIFIIFTTAIYSADAGNHAKRNNETDSHRRIRAVTASESTDSTLHNKCKLSVTDDSKISFTNSISKHAFNFVYLKLVFLNFSVNETRKVINKENWIWTYKGEGGAHQFLFLPGDFGYLSFGLLWLQTHRKPLTIHINETGNCHNLTVGQLETDQLIGQALGEMTSTIASVKDAYNSSYWCYTKRYWIRSAFVYSACKNLVCSFQTLDYTCCKYHKSFSNKTREVICGLDHYEFGALWWMLPIVLGHICWSFYPILLAKVAINTKKISINIKRRKKPLNLRSDIRKELNNSDEGIENKIKDQFIYVDSPNPITFVSTICSPLYGCRFEGPVISRVLRLWIIFLPMTLSTIRVIADYNFARDVVIGAVNKSAHVGFSSIIAGPNQAREHFLKIFGGPHVALSIYILFGCFMIALPSNLEDVLESGLLYGVKDSLLLIRVPIKLKEKLSRITVRQHKGYKQIYKFFLSQMFMLLHMKFWRQAFILFYRRWKMFLFPKLVTLLHSSRAAGVLSITIIPIYVVVCLLELILSVSYFAFPVVNCFFIVLKSFLIHFFKIFKNKGYIMRIIQYTLFPPLLILFCFIWYIYCIIFFDGFWVLSKIAMFTYTGIIAYPKLSYGYIVLAFMATYYLLESFSSFEENYSEYRTK